jgi:hypothetical protein
MSRPSALALVILACLTTAAIADPAPKPRVKDPEVSTVGTTPVTLTEADRAKATEWEHRAAARRASTEAQRQAGVRISAPRSPGKPVEISTRVPSRGPRVRVKPVQPAPTKGGSR